MKNYIKPALFAFAVLAAQSASAFCGFYVAKADIKLFNKTSQVIIVRNGEQSTITMSSDFEGDVKDFAMVVPVPVVLQENNIRIADRALFDKLDAYSAPRLVEYYDPQPCYTNYPKYKGNTRAVPMAANKSMDMEGESVNSINYQVKVEAKYTVGEYDILILSAKESGGLERWLTDNGYKIPAGAKEVLEPYVKSNMKFFVVKVNLGEQAKLGAQTLRPIQITFNSPKFMLPIRLGMANATAPQDMIVYAFSKTGRIELTNYRTVEAPTGQKIPLFVKQKFGEFYKDVYNKAWKKEGKSIATLEYAWDVSGTQNVMCDPCVGPPPIFTDLQSAGVDWVSYNTYHSSQEISGRTFFTRLHLTYDRGTFPQDLQFIETPNKENYQARYVLNNPVHKGADFSCSQANDYLTKLHKRRQEEVNNLASIAGWDASKYKDYITEYDKFIKKSTTPGTKKQGNMFIFPDEDENGLSFSLVLLSLTTVSLIVFVLTRKNTKKVPVNK
jgi:hypothetical protein